MPKIDSNINSVPLNYFMEGVQAARNVQQVSTQLRQDSAERNEENVQGQVRQNSASRLMMQLDILMTKAAVASTKSIDGKTVKTSLQGLVDAGVLEKNSLKQLAKTADNASKALKALDKFTGAQLAAAVKQVSDGEGVPAHAAIDEKSKAGKAVAAAVMAQNDLADMLAQLFKGLDAYDRRAGQNQDANAQGVDPHILNDISEMRMLCDRRATEINALAYQMHDFALNQAANGQETDPHITTILNAKVKELLPRQALAMHGTADSLGAVNKEISDKLMPLAERIDAIRNKPSGTIDAASLLSLQTDIRTMKSAITDIKLHGISVAGGERIIVAQDIVKALESELSNLEEQFGMARTSVAARIRQGVHATAKKLLGAYVGEESQLAHANQPLLRLFALRNIFFRVLDEYIQVASNARSKGEIAGKFKEVQKAGSLLADCAEKYKGPGIGSFFGAGDFFHFLASCKKCSSIVNQFALIDNMLLGSKDTMSGNEIMSIFSGKFSVSAIVELRARDLKDEDFDPRTDERNIASSRCLGCGNSGEVHELTTVDGEKYVFKGELDTRTGLGAICVGDCGEYSHTQMVVHLNIAANKVANALGCGELLVNNTAGTHQGVFGLFMDKAPGLCAADTVSRPSKAPAGGLSAKEIKRLPAAEKQKINADLKRQLNRLQWLDIVTGQMDRHKANYFIHVDRETHKVTVKGIDNDAGFSQYRTGVATYTLDKAKTDDLLDEIKDLSEEIDSSNNQREYDNLMADSGITRHEDGTITVDATRIQNPALKTVFSQTLGNQTIAVPDKIDRDMYNSLMELKNNQQKRQAFFAQLEGRLSQKSIEATRMRLDDAIAHAERLGREGKIVEKDDWGNQNEQPRPSGKVSVTTLRGKTKTLSKRRSDFFNLVTSTSFYARDGLDKIF